MSIEIKSTGDLDDYPISTDAFEEGKGAVVEPVLTEPAPAVAIQETPVQPEEEDALAESDVPSIPEEELEGDAEQVTMKVERPLHSVEDDVFRESARGAGETALQLPTISLEKISNLLESTQEVVDHIKENVVNSIMVHGASTALIPDEIFQKFFDRTSKLTMRPVSENGVHITQSTPAYKPPPKGAVLDGNEATAYFARINNSYDTAYLVCWHSGIWLKVQVPRGREIHNLMAAIAQTRGDLGYSTRGAIFSSDSALRTCELLDFILDRTVSTNMIDSSRDAIARNLSVLDTQVLAAQLATIRHPSGTVVERACSTKPGACAHVERDVLRLSKIIWTDPDIIGDKQKTFLETVMRKNSLRKEEEIEEYRNSLLVNVKSARYVLDDKVTIIFSPPSLSKYRQTTEDWASEIRRDSEDLLRTMTQEEMTRHLESQASLAIMSKYSAWVDHILVGDNIVNSPASVRSLLEKMSDDDETVDKFTAAVSEFMSDCIAAAVGVPEYKCPVCTGAQSKATKGMMMHIAPIDAVASFFTLSQQKIQRSL